MSAATKRVLEEAIADPGNGFFFESAGSVITQAGLAATFMMKLQGDMR